MAAMDWTAQLELATARFTAALREGDLAADVPTCPGWTLADLGEHLRCVHLWAAHAVTEGTPEGWPEPGMLDRPSLVAGYRAAAGHIVEVLRERDADAPVWGFGAKPHTAGFWHRRQTHETLIHLYDALATSGRDGEWEVAPELAWDGVEEVVSMFYPRQLRLGRTEHVPGTLRLRATDIDATVDLGDTEPVVEIEDTAARMLLVLWERTERPPRAAALLDSAAITP